MHVGGKCREGSTEWWRNGVGDVEWEMALRDGSGDEGFGSDGSLGEEVGVAEPPGCVECVAYAHGSPQEVTWATHACTWRKRSADSAVMPRNPRDSFTNLRLAHMSRAGVSPGNGGLCISTDADVMYTSKECGDVPAAAPPAPAQCTHAHSGLPHALGSALSSTSVSHNRGAPLPCAKPTPPRHTMPLPAGATLPSALPQPPSAPGPKTPGKKRVWKPKLRPTSQPPPNGSTTSPHL